MGKLYDRIDDHLRAFFEAQHVFFVGTAPLSANGHVNVSPKGLDALRVLDPRTLIYLDYVGSGAETIAHVRENSRIVIMLCAFQGPPKIVRLHGTGEVLEPGDSGYAELRGLFAPEPQARAIIRVSVDRIADSCGYGVPLHMYQGERTQLLAWATKKGEEGLREYQEEKNSVSIDGLPALRWPASEVC
jgi:predicted pyridoxine 5'-phosphate oxidase superfamily flavin-nucleotide-binding protein